MKEQILKLHGQGKSYNEISLTLGCAKSTIAYHINPKVKEKQYLRNSTNRRAAKADLVQNKGGKCEICHYDKCLSALEFHHTNPDTKEFDISSIRHMKPAMLKKELAKCILVCCRCHREIHEKWDAEG